MTGHTQDSTVRLNPQRIFLTGEPGCGKTTVVVKVANGLQARGLKVGGMVTEEIREGKTRTGFYVENIITHERGILAMVGSGEGPRIGKYTVSLRDFEAVGVKAIQAAIEDADVMVVDELGPMELNSGRFIESVEEALNSRKHIVGTIHKRATHPLVMAVKSNANFTIVEVTAENRGELPPQIIDRILQAR